ncbi:DUF1178 family protein [Pollutimonas bauzanensis]|uniref:Uncharacterized protein n=1 Tax=Pollutimonas bauzanensis TaxID=658167 RepID=A0A1M5ZH75_9BURK|nr:DUF1178 family protein [Pollutimonas bauzanensis]SHI23283.1 hypothetical protein SAMN04488135_114141 [Pollutimonas bauzanensis]
MSLKVFDLQCDQGHVFEGWFASADSYESQQSRGLLSCPVCNSSRVAKKLSAPRLNLGHAKAPAPAAPASAARARPGTAVAAPAAGQMAQLQAEVMRHIRQMVRNTENVGARFAEEARRMHDGQAQERAIRGTATPEEREELAEEGIAVMPIPEFLDDDRLQ